MFIFAPVINKLNILYYFDMRKVLVSFEVFVSQDKTKPFVCAHPDFIFSGEFDKDDDTSFKSMCDLEYQVVSLAHSFKVLDCQVSVLRKEFNHVNV